MNGITFHCIYWILCVKSKNGGQREWGMWRVSSGKSNLTQGSHLHFFCLSRTYISFLWTWSFTFEYSQKISGILGRLPKWCNSLDWLMPCSINLHSWLPLQLDLCPNQFLFLSFFICIILTNQGKHNHVNQINFLHILNHFVFYLNKQSLFNNIIENNDNCVFFK